MASIYKLVPPDSLPGVAVTMTAVVAHDTNDNTGKACIGLYITTGGTVAFVDVQGGDVSVTVPDSFTLPVAVDRVMATGTTASGIFAFQGA